MASKYNDCYITLTEDELILHKYYFPTGTSKIIILKEIEQIWVGTDPALGLRFWNKKSWGMAFSNVFWAWAAGREFSSNNDNNFVVSVIGANIRCGFSVEDVETFRPLIEQYMKE